VFFTLKNQKTGTLRPTFSKRYFSEERANAATVTEAALRYKYGNVAREFVIEAIDMYLRMHYNCKWRAAVVISHAEIESSQLKLFRAPVPLLIQVFSRYWVYDKYAYGGDTVRVWPTDSIYESIAVWMHQCLVNYQGRVFDVDLSLLLNKILYPPVVAAQHLGGIQREI
jgi:hypothetical protein